MATLSVDAAKIDQTDGPINRRDINNAGIAAQKCNFDAGKFETGAHVNDASAPNVQWVPYSI
jgi:hypothetical protein